MSAFAYLNPYHYASTELFIKLLNQVRTSSTSSEPLSGSVSFKPYSHFKAIMNLGWKKLNKYVLSDQTPVYRFAVHLHPRYETAWFKLHWSSIGGSGKSG
ncbi:hypothetical protein M433DRAFT_8934 [Acidomyces richmondensis BFW]|nr:MAG: hypothetical protein FE78DRAFT_34481 [Acidomyces sp. 'richmondensis']KYG40328.1 hypothetical protein M433DRAFT_8934 [Acidomyces richmondensis BFW]